MAETTTDRVCPTNHFPCRLPHLPACAGEADPALCGADLLTLANRSKLLSSVHHDWPARPQDGRALHAAWSRSRLVAPGQTLDCAPPHTGRAAVRGSDREVTATFAHLGTPECAEVAARLLRLQTVRPYVLIHDTGSDLAAMTRLEGLRSEGVELHYLRAHSYRSSSEAVMVACDLALVQCQTEWLFYTHSDCFAVSRTLIERFRDRCTPENPVVGYQITDRSAETAEWVWMTGHTALMVHVPTIQRAGIQWGWNWGLANAVRPAGEKFIDTESEFNWGCKRAGITPDLVGSEENHKRNTNEDFDHVRSYATGSIYPSSGPAEHREHRAAWMAAALAEGRARADGWEADDARRAGKIRGNLAETIRTDERGGCRYC